MHRVTWLCILLFFSETVSAGDNGFKSLFNGKDLTGWTGTKEQKGHWKVEDGALVFDGKVGKQDLIPRYTETRLSTEKTFGDFELMFDWMPSGKTKWTNLRYRGDGSEGVESGEIAFLARGEVWVSTPPTAAVFSEKAELPAGKWNRVKVRVNKQKVSVHINGKTAIENYGEFGVDGPGAISFDGDGEVRIRNIFIRELKDGK